MTSQCNDLFSFVIPAKLVPGLNREPESRYFLSVRSPGVIEKLLTVQGSSMVSLVPAVTIEDPLIGYHYRSRSFVIHYRSNLDVAGIYSR